MTSESYSASPFSRDELIEEPIVTDLHHSHAEDDLKKIYEGDKSSLDGFNTETNVVETDLAQYTRTKRHKQLRLSTSPSLWKSVLGGLLALACTLPYAAYFTHLINKSGREANSTEGPELFNALDNETDGIHSITINPLIEENSSLNQRYQNDFGVSTVNKDLPDGTTENRSGNVAQEAVPLPTNIEDLVGRRDGDAGDTIDIEVSPKSYQAGSIAAPLPLRSKHEERGESLQDNDFYLEQHKGEREVYNQVNLGGVICDNWRCNLPFDSDLAKWEDSEFLDAAESFVSRFMDHRLNEQHRLTFMEMERRKIRGKYPNLTERIEKSQGKDAVDHFLFFMSLQPLMQNTSSHGGIIYRTIVDYVRSCETISKQRKILVGIQKSIEEIMNSVHDENLQSQRQYNSSTLVELRRDALDKLFNALDRLTFILENKLPELKLADIFASADLKGVNLGSLSQFAGDGMETMKFITSAYSKGKMHDVGGSDEVKYTIDLNLIKSGLKPLEDLMRNHFVQTLDNFEVELPTSAAVQALIKLVDAVKANDSAVALRLVVEENKYLGTPLEITSDDADALLVERRISLSEARHAAVSASRNAELPVWLSALV